MSDPTGTDVPRTPASSPRAPDGPSPGRAPTTPGTLPATTSGLLDPCDWEAFRATCRGAVDEMVERFRTGGEGPVWRDIPDEVVEAFHSELPRAGRPLDDVLDDVRENLLPYTLGNTHPRFFGWVHGAGTPAGALAEFLAGSMNANTGGRYHAPILVEQQVVAWMRELFGFPTGASGLLVSGTSMATVVGLAVARHRACGGADRTDGLRGAASLVGYASADGHQSIRDAFALLGLGGRSLRPIPLDRRGAIDAVALEARIEADLADGHRPFAVTATAGSVTCGATDDLVEIRRIADRHGLWMHVDGAFGAAARLAPGLARRLAGIERADSIAFDFHKWFHVPYDAGCILVRDGEAHRATFGGREDYLTSLPFGPASGEVWPCDLGPELSRGFRAFKVWFALQALGAEAIGRAVERNCMQARALAARVDRETELERLAPAELNIVCFRYVPAGRGDARATSPDAPARPSDTRAEELNDLNRDLLMELHRRGIAVPSPVRRGDALGLRVCLCNHRTTRQDLRLLLDAVLEIGRELAAARSD
jgi:aromatic-L-amino-acid/L-tryptophan decarboxylase